MKQVKKTRDLAAIILAGGKSSRYQHRNKALIKLNGMSLLDHVLSQAYRLTSHIVIVSNNPDIRTYYPEMAVPDDFPDTGPLGAIYTGLRHSNANVNFVVACDMPFVNINLAQYMMTKMGFHDAIIPRVGRLIEPLHALYHARSLPAIQRNLDTKIFKIQDLFPLIRLKYLESDVIRCFDPDFHLFTNINEPSDLAKAKEVVNHGSRAHLPYSR